MWPHHLLGPEWRTRGLRQTGWVLLPLRAFLGVTFVLAALQKLADPAFFDAHSPTSIQAQTHLFERTSPIGGIVRVAGHDAALLGLLIAVGELAVGLGTLLGLWARAAAVAGALLSLTFFLTVSWNTSPYYYGADIVFLFAWTPLIAVGAAGVLSADLLLAARARADLRLPEPPAVVGVTTLRLRAVCPRGDGCGVQVDGTCSRAVRCPVLAPSAPVPAGTREELSRRTLLRGARVGAVVAGAGALLGGFSALVGRAAGGTTGTAGRSRAATVAPATHPSSSATQSSPASAPGTVVGRASQVPVGQAASFTDPASGDPAWVVHPSGSSFVAFNAVCTHAGCTVQFDAPSMQFQCPCHGGVYDAKTGQVLAGPPPSPLQSIPVHVLDGQIRVD